MVIRRLGVWSVAKISGALYAGLGLIFGAVFALVSTLGASFAAASGDGSTSPLMGTLFGVGAIIFLPLLYGCMGLVFGAISAALYNVFSGMVGGIQIETDPVLVR